jgi:hypothetical protein
LVLHPISGDDFVKLHFPPPGREPGIFLEHFGEIALVVIAHSLADLRERREK